MTTFGPNWSGTSLYGYNGCTKNGFSKAKINDAYYDQWKLTNRKGVKKDIDWNSAAALEYLGPPANNEKYQDRIQNLFYHASSVIYSYKNPYAHYIHVRCDDPEKKCGQKCKPSNGDRTDQDGGTIAYASQEDPDDGYSMINFCPPFIPMRRLRDAAIDYGKARKPPLNSHVEQYKSTAQIMLHEIFHLDYFMDVSGASHVTDLSIYYIKNVDGSLTSVTGKWLPSALHLTFLSIPSSAVTMRDRTLTANPFIDKAYGATNTKMMARFQEFINPVGRLVGSYTMRNADSLAYFATASYVQSRTGTYPHLPIVYKQIEGPPFKDIGKSV